MINRFCLASGTEYQVLQTPAVTPLPTEYADCHAHGTETYGAPLPYSEDSRHQADQTRFCVALDGSEVQIALEGAEVVAEEETSTEAETTATAATGTNCHFHGNVESVASIKLFYVSLTSLDTVLAAAQQQRAVLLQSMTMT